MILKASMAKAQRKITGDAVFRVITMLAAYSILGLLIFIFIGLLYRSRLSLAEFTIGFIFNNDWNPVTGQFGALSSIYGTVIATIIAMLIAVPLSFFISFFLVEIAPPSIAKPVGYAIELLAAIPSIIYGMWGLFVFAPVMAEYIQPLLGKTLGKLPFFAGPPMGIGMLTAGIILALMILPFMTAITRDIFNMTPKSLREAAFGMGATTWEVTRKVTLRHGMGGIIGGIFLGLGRALGETMAVTFVIGNNHEISASLFKPANTIASTLANEFAEASEPLYLSALTELGLILFAITFVVNGGAHLLLKRYKTVGAGEKK